MARDNSELDIHVFNRLPTPEIFARQPLAFNTINDLKEAFTFLFKPNRAVALYPESSDSSHDPGHPIKDKRTRWLIKFSLCNKPHSTDLSEQRSLFIVTINQRGILSLWQYKTSTNPSGILPIQFKELSTNHFDLYDNPAQDALRPILNQRFELIYATSYCDEENVVILRLTTPNFEHLIKLDFGTYFNQAQQAVPHHHVLWETDKKIDYYSKRQIGGWGEGVKLFWGGQKNTIIEGSSYSGATYTIHSDNLNNALNPRIWTAAKYKDYLVVGGDEASVWVLNNDKQTFRDLDQQHHIKGYVRSVEIIPLPTALVGKTHSKYLILVGCDDYYFYVLDTDGNLLQKVNMQGLVDGIMYLNNQPTDGVDIAVLVRNRGVFCLRLFYARLEFDGIDKQREYFLASLKKLVDDSLANTVQRWLRSSAPRDNLLAITLIIKEPDPQLAQLFQSAEPLFSGLQNITIDYLRHFLFKKLRKLNQSPQHLSDEFTYYLDLLHYLADEHNPLHIREIVRSLLGWLQLIQMQQNLKPLLKKVLDEKRALRSLATEINMSSVNLPATLEKIVKFCAIEYDLINSWVFVEEIIFPTTDDGQGIGQVDNVAIIGVGGFGDNKPATKQSSQIYIRRGEDRLAAFRLEKTEPYLAIGIREEDQQCTIPQDNPVQLSPPDIRVLLPLKAENEDFIVVASRQIGIARRGEPEINWRILNSCYSYSEKTDSDKYEFHSPSQLWSGVAFKIPSEKSGQTQTEHNTNTFILAVAGEWLVSSHEEIVYGFIVDADTLNFTQLPTGFFAVPSDWREPVRFRDLIWDKAGNLWGITGDKGYVFCWQHVIEAIRDPDIKTSVERIVTIGSPQNAILVLEDKVICGGHDGVLRAFDAQGRLLWVNLVPGIIRKIATTSSLLELNERTTQFAAIAIITDRGDLLLYSQKGILKGGVNIPHLPLTCLYSGLLKKDGNQHHLIGAITGEVRLVEEVPNDWQAEDYFNTGNTKDETQLYQAIRPQIKQWRSQANQIEVLTQYCTLDTAYKEPLIAAWAACQLLKTLETQHYPLVLQMLEAIYKAKKQFQMPSHQKMLVHIFAMLGQFIQHIPKNSYSAVIHLYQLVSDRILAAFLANIPRIAARHKLTTKALELAWEKVKTAEFILTGSALLQQFRDTQDEIYILNALNFKTTQLAERTTLEPLNAITAPAEELDNSNLPQLNQHKARIMSGYIEGGIATLFNILHRSPNSKDFSIIFCLSIITHQFKNLAALLIAETVDIRLAFHNWLDLYNETIFSKRDAQFWRTLSPILQEKTGQELDAQEILNQLRSLIKKFNYTNSRDVRALKNFMALFPYSNLGIYEKLPTNRYALPNSWRIYIDTTQALRIEIERIGFYAIKHHEIAGVLDDLENKVNSISLPTPLFNNLHFCWQKQWKAEIRHLREEYIVSQPLAFQKNKDLSPNTEITVERFFRAMQSIGLTHGRFYKLITMPGCDGLLELNCYNGDLKVGYQLPVKKIIDGQLLDYIHMFENTEPKTRHFFHMTHHYKINDEKDSGFAFWDSILQKNMDKPWIMIPVLTKRSSEQYYQTMSAKYQVLGLFTFDGDEINKLTEEEADFNRIVYTRILSIKDILLKIIGDVENALVLEQELNEFKLFHILDQLDKKLFYEDHREVIEQSFLQTACELVNAYGGMLVSHEEGLKQLVVRATVGDEQELLKEFRFSLAQDFYPIVKAWNDEQALFLPNFQESTEGKALKNGIENGQVSFDKLAAFKKWVYADIGSYVAIPVFSGTRKVGAISLQSRIPYQFDDNAAKALEFLVRRIRWFLHAIDTIDYKRMWERAVMHEVLSELVLVDDSIEVINSKYIDTNNQAAVNELKQAKAHCNKISDLAYNFKAIQANPNVDISEYFDFNFTMLDELLIFYYFKIYILNYSSLENQFSTPIRLIGDQEDFIRILRNLLDNARKFGLKSINVVDDELNNPFIIIQSCFVDEGHWQIQISNPGWMNESENAFKFVAYKGIHGKTKGQGFHVGLAASQVWANAYGGNITVENTLYEGEQRVTAKLTWQLAEPHNNIINA